MASLTPYRLHKTRVRMDDDRILNYYDFGPASTEPPYLQLHVEAAQANPPAAQRILPKPSEMRWHPVRNEWVVYAAHRMNRPQLPSRDACPICPGILELSLPYQITIFENRAPALAYVPGPQEPAPDVAPVTFDLKLDARGRCDMVVYSQEHDSKFALMPLDNVYGLIEAWRDRYREHIALPEIQFVSIFENKGRDAGMTLDHPHGQIYAFSFLPPDLLQQLKSSLGFAATGQNLWQQIIEREQRDQVRVIAETDNFLAAIPYFARYPYETHIWAKRDGVSSLLEMTPGERRELSGIMKNIALRFEHIWPGNTYGFPTLMLMQQLTGIPGSEHYRFHIEYYPLQRSPEKLKYRASIETAAGTFLNDALPETQAAELREVAPQSVELPALLFED